MLGGPVLWSNDDQRFDACWLTLSMEVCNGKETQGFNDGTHNRKKRWQACNEQQKPACGCEGRTVR
jgi:hypothetical protein